MSKSRHGMAYSSYEADLDFRNGVRMPPHSTSKIRNYVKQYTRLLYSFERLEAYYLIPANRNPGHYKSDRLRMGPMFPHRRTTMSTGHKIQILYVESERERKFTSHPATLVKEKPWNQHYSPPLPPQAVTNTVLMSIKSLAWIVMPLLSWPQVILTARRRYYERH